MLVGILVRLILHRTCVGGPARPFMLDRCVGASSCCIRAALFQTCLEVALAPGGCVSPGEGPCPLTPRPPHSHILTLRDLWRYTAGRSALPRWPGCSQERATPSRSWCVHCNEQAGHSVHSLPLPLPLPNSVSQSPNASVPLGPTLQSGTGPSATAAPSYPLCIPTLKSALKPTL